MSSIEAKGVRITLPANIKIRDGQITRADEVVAERTLDEAEVEKLIETRPAPYIPNPLNPAALPAAEIGMLERAAKSEKKGPRLFFYVVFALLPASCMQAATYGAARAQQGSWLWVALMGIAVALIVLQIILIVTEKRRPSGT
ncbi:MAG TPA: hypothetical protein VFV15_03490 [Moraxellaceae bacterium]|nr:hypothetical protein [Moraxellaceae bacterium]